LLTCTRDDRRRRLTVVATGTVTLEDSIAFQERQAKDGTWSYAILYDGRGREGLLTTTDVAQLGAHTASLTTRYGRPGPLAILRTDEAGFGVGRMFGIFNDGRRFVGVFRDLADAEKWLDMQ
jgi:hypothetical protein